MRVWPKWYPKLSAGRAKTRPQNPSSCLPHCPSSVSSLGIFLWSLECFAQILTTQTSAHFDSEPKKWELNSALLPPIWVTYKGIDLAGSLASQLLSTINWRLPRAFAICLCGDWILCCCSCWPALKGVQGGEWGTLCSRETSGTGL